MRRLTKAFAVVVTFVFCVSCEDEVLMQRDREQKKEIAELRSELKLLKEISKGSDPYYQIQQLQMDQDDFVTALDKLETEVTAIEEELVTLAGEKIQMEEEYKKYRATYSIGSLSN